MILFVRNLWMIMYLLINVAKVTGQNGVVENLPTTITIPENFRGSCPIYQLRLSEDDEITVFTFIAYPPESEILFFFDANDLTVHAYENATFDFEVQNTHVLEFHIFYKSWPEPYNLTINIGDENDAPFFPKDVYFLDFQESMEKQSMTLQAVDVDAEDTLVYKVHDINDTTRRIEAPFHLNQTTGELSFKANYDVDHGQPSQFYLKMSATDSGNLIAFTTIIIRIHNTNDNSPSCKDLTTYTPLCIPLGVPIVNLTAEDIDGSPVSFSFSSKSPSINESNLGNYPLRQTFSLTENGSLSLKQNISSETYFFNIIVNDTGGLTGHCIVTVRFFKCDINISSSDEKILFELNENDKEVCKNNDMLYWVLPLCIVICVGVILFLTAYVCKLKLKTNPKTSIEVFDQKD
ncbi:protocadherin beta-4-like [Saccostrea cucullata]|uniref:protocadherin beta-4-like n=1 Tax=Saccostrea cuccullata TaxID=36930 RepID=UPI002ED2657F